MISHFYALMHIINYIIKIVGYYGAKYSYDSCPALQMDLEDTKTVLNNMRNGVLGKWLFHPISGCFMIYLILLYY